MSRRRIENEEQYQNAIAWLVKKAEEFEDPLLDPDKADKMLEIYDYVAGEIKRYRSPDNGLPIAESAEPKKTVNLSDFLEE
jgi:antitoxin component HigA of HigAB toxin-antitoxin module